MEYVRQDRCFTQSSTERKGGPGGTEGGYSNLPVSFKVGPGTVSLVLKDHSPPPQDLIIPS